MWAGQRHVLPDSTYTPTLYPLGQRRSVGSAALKLVKGDRLIVVGCSVGGSCALELAVAAPGRVAALVLSGPKPGIGQTLRCTPQR
jgi:pimeloyl-ACP methyl ester carboxylesterase